MMDPGRPAALLVCARTVGPSPESGQQQDSCSGGGGHICAGYHGMLRQTDLSISSVPEPVSTSSSGLKPQMLMPWNLFPSVFLVKSQQNPLAIKEAQPKSRTLHVALPSKPAEPPTTTLQSRSSHGPGLAPVPTPTPRPRARGPSGTSASSGPGPR